MSRSIDVTEGAACTVLLAREYIDTDRAADARQQRPVGRRRTSTSYLARSDRHRADGLIMTMKADDAKWSFVGLDRSRFVTRVVEKQVISDEATVGIYNFRRGRDFVQAADADDREEPARQQRVLRRPGLQRAHRRRRTRRDLQRRAAKAPGCTAWVSRTT